MVTADTDSLNCQEMSPNLLKQTRAVATRGRGSLPFLAPSSTGDVPMRPSFDSQPPPRGPEDPAMGRAIQNPRSTRVHPEMTALLHALPGMADPFFPSLAPSRWCGHRRQLDAHLDTRPSKERPTRKSGQSHQSLLKTRIVPNMGRRPRADLHEMVCDSARLRKRAKPCDSRKGRNTDACQATSETDPLAT